MSRFLALATTVLLILPGLALADETQELAIPDKAPCTVCTLGGQEHGEEKVKGHSVYEGTAYYFCNMGCKERFDADPMAYVPPTFPMPAPEFTVMGVDETALDLAAYEGQWLLLDFWATWCKPCVKLMPQISEMAARFESRGLTVLGVSVDEDREKALKFAKKKKISYPIATENPDAPAWAAYHVAVVPTAFLINPKGEIVERWMGDWDHEAVAATLDEQLPKP